MLLMRYVVAAEGDTIIRCVFSIIGDISKSETAPFPKKRQQFFDICLHFSLDILMLDCNFAHRHDDNRVIGEAEHILQQHAMHKRTNIRHVQASPAAACNVQTQAH